mmetsp:Transcript_75835/g.218997  ORF Transcript_75835/g.218997 Transcript_75835/m.218997 type:complete len:541 (-) Transcript_75835:373-1995(-)
MCVETQHTCDTAAAVVPAGSACRKYESEVDMEHGGLPPTGGPIIRRTACAVRIAKAAPFAIRRGIKALGTTVISLTILVALLRWPHTLIDDATIRRRMMILLFAVGMMLLVFEKEVGVSKSAAMLIVSTSMWALLAVGYHSDEALKLDLNKGLFAVGAVILFRLPVMAVVDFIDHFDGFAVVTVAMDRASNGRVEYLTLILGFSCFFLSAIADNLTATNVCVKLMRHLVGSDRHLRQSIGCFIVVAANAGGVWSPAGDVTTTMIWLADEISVGRTMRWLFVPALAVLMPPMFGILCEVRRGTSDANPASVSQPHVAKPKAELPAVTLGNVSVLALGITCIMMVPALDVTAGLPPYVGMLLALGTIWFVTDTAWFRQQALSSRTGSRDAQGFVSVGDVLRTMDLTGVLFFGGVLLAVGALDTSGVLEHYTAWLKRHCDHKRVLLCSLLGLSSAVVNNVPVTQVTIEMFKDAAPTDNHLWQLLSLAVGTGGSISSIGSVAGVTLMTMEGVSYISYCRTVSLLAAAGFALGIATYEAERLAFS